MPRTIRYAVSVEENCIVSRVGNEFAWPIMDYEKIGEGGDYTKPIEYNLKKISVNAINSQSWDALVFTKQLPVEVKNFHRKFWNMTPLPAEPRPSCLQELCKRRKVSSYFMQENHMDVAIFHGIYGSRGRGPRGIFHFFEYHNRDGMMGYDWVGCSMVAEDYKKHKLDPI